MKITLLRPTTLFRTAAVFFVATIFLGLLLFAALAGRAHADEQAQKESGTLLTIHDRGVDQVIITRAHTVGDALKDADISLAEQDAVEPALDQELVADEYSVNIYRARPVVVVDGGIRQKVMTAYQTAEQITDQVGITLYPEDKTEISRSQDILADGASLTLHITRAKVFSFVLYGQGTEVRTQGKTVADMLKEKGITLGADDRVSPDVSSPLTAGITVTVWREGKQTVTVDEAVPFGVDQEQDADRLIGYKEVRTAGQEGTATVTYEIEIRDGVEVARTKIASLTKTEPITQVEVVGIKNSGNGLTESKGVNMYTDSQGVTHRETYYDLPMNVVMRNCGAGGQYTVRADGVKVDAQGYILIAAHLGLYPRCTLVETSLGIGKVYDTGGFADVHATGFDIATDWTNNNGI